MPNKVLTFLSKLGKGVLAASQQIEVIGPIVKAFTPDKVDLFIDKVDVKLSQIEAVVITAEIMGEQIKAAQGLATLDKAALAAPIAMQLLADAARAAGREVRDPVAAGEAAKRLVGAYADWLNALK